MSAEGVAGLSLELRRFVHDLADRAAARCGERLLAFGKGPGATDAQHVAVEFVHPVIVGKRAVPALSLVRGAAPPEVWPAATAKRLVS